MANNNNAPARRFVFTINNPQSPLSFSPETHPLISYAVWQRELAPTTGTPHFQGYLEVKRASRFTALHKYPGLEHASFQTAKGSAEQNFQYCTKENSREDGPWTYGTPAKQGVATGLTAAKRALDEGLPEADIANDYFPEWCRFNRAFTQYKKLKQEPRNFKTEVIFLYGPPGTGKSSWIKENSPDCHWKSQDKWFDGYDGTSDVALDDFYGWIPYSQMLRLMDRYPTDVEVKGGKVTFAPKRLFITSNKLPHEWYNPDVPFNHDAFYRRVNKIIYMPALGEEWEYAPDGTDLTGATFADFHIRVGTHNHLVRNFT